eukprot:gene9019-biopygen10702
MPDPPHPTPDAPPSPPSGGFGTASPLIGDRAKGGVDMQCSAGQDRVGAGQGRTALYSMGQRRAGRSWQRSAWQGRADKGRRAGQCNAGQGRIDESRAVQGRAGMSRA